MDLSLSELREFVMDREAWRAAIHGVTKSRTRLSNWTELKWPLVILFRSICHKIFCAITHHLWICFLILRNNKILKAIIHSFFVPLLSMYLYSSWGFSLPHMVHQSHDFTSSITKAVRTQAEQWNSLFTNSTWKENLSLWNTKKVLSWAGRAMLVEFSGPVMRCPATLPKQSHSFPQLPECLLLIAQSWNCSSGIALGHNETLHQSYISFQRVAHNQCPANREIQCHRHFASIWRPLWRLLELPVGLGKASACNHFRCEHLSLPSHGFLNSPQVQVPRALPNKSLCNSPFKSLLPGEGEGGTNWQSSIAIHMLLRVT